MAGPSGQLLYFAYGADLRREDFVRRCPGSDWLGLARLEGHRFVIGPQGLATIKPDKEATVWGALWLVPAGELAALDVFAGVPQGLSERTTRRIVSPAGPRTEAMMYVGQSAGAAGPSAAGYMASIIAGADENRLPAAYLKELQTWAKAKG
ncbi:MAG: gamma-glutamylcyclotransferase family protein [Opitutaceae bacterium]|jgi:gamma-glutamylcyclotransferase (GGCT)/AIG2-like uncharacterized protein YtfP